MNCKPRSTHCLAHTGHLVNIKQVAVFSENIGSVGMESKGCSLRKCCWVSFEFAPGYGGLVILVAFRLAFCFLHNCLFFVGSAVSFPFAFNVVSIKLYPPLGLTSLETASRVLLPSGLGHLSSFLPLSALPLPAVLTLIIEMPLLPSLLWCLYWDFHSALLSDMGLDLSRIRSFCFITLDEHWGERDPERVECPQQRKRPLFPLSDSPCHSVWPTLLSVKFMPSEFQWANHLIFLEYLHRPGVVGWANPACFQGAYHLMGECYTSI